MNCQNYSHLDHLRKLAFRAAFEVTPATHDKDIKDLKNDIPWATHYESASRVICNGGMAAFLGDRGTGKTQMAVSLIRDKCDCHELDENHMRFVTTAPKIALYRRVSDVLNEAKGSYRSGSNVSLKAILGEYAKVPLLVLDEVHELGDSEHDIKIITSILDKRYFSQKASIMIANCDARQFAKMIGPSIVDRIHETGGVLKFDWDSFRRRSKES